MKRRVLTPLAVGSALALVACGNILGLKDLQPYPDEGGAEGGGNDGSGDDGTSSGADGSDAMLPDGMVPADAREEDGAIITHDSSTGNDSSTTDSSAADSSTGTDSSTGMDSSTGTDTGTGVDSGGTVDSSMPETGGCTGSQTFCNGSCVDTTTDGHNCGMCGHDCLAGDGSHCSASVCSPVQLSSGVKAFDLAVVHPTASTTSLYWVDQNATVGASHAWECTLSGSPTTCSASAISTGATTMTSTERIAFDGTNTIYWTEFGTGAAANGRVWQYPIGGNASSITSGIWAPEGIGADTSFVYWIVGGASPNVTTHTVGGSSTPHALGSSSSPAGLAQGSGQVYWAESGTPAVGGCHESSCTPGAVETGVTTPWAVAVDTTSFYWTEYAAAGSVWRAAMANPSNLMQLGSTEGYPVRIAADATGVVWVDNGTTATNGSVVACPPAGSPCRTVAANLRAPVGLAIDSKAIYYGTTGDGILWLLAR